MATEENQPLTSLPSVVSAATYEIAKDLNMMASVDVRNPVKATMNF